MNKLGRLVSLKSVDPKYWIYTVFKRGYIFFFLISFFFFFFCGGGGEGIVHIRLIRSAMVYNVSHLFW